MTNNYETATPHLASNIIFRKDAKVAFLLRQNTSWMDGHYCLIGGKVEKGETFTEAAIREAKEEAGVELKPDQLRVALTGFRQANEYDWVDVLFEVIHYDSEPYNAESDVHASLEWLDPYNLPENTVPSIRYYMAEILAGRTFCEIKIDE